MAFTTTNGELTVFGNKRIFTCNFVNDSGSTGGEVVTGLSTVEKILIGHSGSAVVGNAPVYNETLPLNEGSVTVVTDADTSGTFMAIGL